MKRSLIPLSLLTACSLSLFGASAAPFSVEIVDRGECGPVAPNDAPSRGMAKNRRADVALRTQQKYHVMQKRRIVLPGGGMIWASSDPAMVIPHLDILSRPYAQKRMGAIIGPITFATYSNYHRYFDRYRLLIYTKDLAGRPIPLKLFEGKELPKKIVWDGTCAAGTDLRRATHLYYVLRVYDHEGHYDQTRERAIRLGAAPAASATQDPARLIYGKSSLNIHHIPVHGARVRIHARDIPRGYRLNIDGENVDVDDRGGFVLEEIMPAGKRTVLVALMDPQGTIYKKRLTLDVTDSYFFLVGLADLTVGSSHISGHIVPTVRDDDLFTDGRVAFHLKGKIKGTYLITAQMDTQEDELSHMGRNISREDPTRLFRHLDPDRYYYVYGDDAHLHDDTDSQGRLYVRVDWDGSRALWGNFNTGITQNEYANVDRSLYGAKLRYVSTKSTAHDDPKSELILYGSPSRTLPAHNQFLGTGGSLYYLKHREIVEGSAKLWIEVRQKGSDRAISRIPLRRGRDYEIDELQGRIILAHPLMTYVRQKGPSLIKDMPLDGDALYLMADYEYLSDLYPGQRATYGARGKEWLNDHVAVGATYAHEDRDGGDYELKGADLTMKANERSYLKVEYAKSASTQSFEHSLQSEDGGLTFHPLDAALSSRSRGEAVGVEARADLRDLSDRMPEGAIGAWWKQRNAGFSTNRLHSGERDHRETGVEASIKTGASSTLSARALHTEEGAQRTDRASAQFNLRHKRFDGAVQLSHIKERNSTTEGRATLGAVKLGYAPASWFDLYTIVQQTLDHSGSYTRNDLYTVGASADLSRLTLNAEASTGDRGDALQFGAHYAVGDRESLYGTYTLSTDRTDARSRTLTLGERTAVTDALSLYSEHQFVHADHGGSIGHLYGLRYAPDHHLSYTLSMQGVRLDETALRGLDRRAISGGVRYTSGRLRASSTLEYRRDAGDEAHTRQYLTSNALDYRFSPSWRILAKLNYALTQDRRNGTTAAKFIESGIGLAYRPLWEKRLSMLGRYTYLYDLVTAAQSLTRPDEVSHIVETELAWELSRYWSVGGKLGYKRYRLRAQRGEGDWYTGALRLAAFRLNYHLLHKWDALAEFHWLDDDHDSSRSGWLVGAYRKMGPNLKLGVGYNFTTFSDDLRAANDYDTQGWFVNLVGAY